MYFQNAARYGKLMNKHDRYKPEYVRLAERKYEMLQEDRRSLPSIIKETTVDEKTGKHNFLISQQLAPKTKHGPTCRPIRKQGMAEKAEHKPTVFPPISKKDNYLAPKTASFSLISQRNGSFPQSISRKNSEHTSKNIISKKQVDSGKVTELNSNRSPQKLVRQLTRDIEIAENDTSAAPVVASTIEVKSGFWQGLLPGVNRTLEQQQLEQERRVCKTVIDKWKLRMHSVEETVLDTVKENQRMLTKARRI